MSAASCAPVSLFIPAYLVMVMGGPAALRGVLPAVTLCGIAFASMQFLVSSFIGPQLTDILGSFAAMGSLVGLLMFWKPSRRIRRYGSALGRRERWSRNSVCLPVRADRSRLQR